MFFSQEVLPFTSMSLALDGKFTAAGSSTSGPGIPLGPGELPGRCSLYRNCASRRGLRRQRNLKPMPGAL